MEMEGNVAGVPVCMEITVAGRAWNRKIRRHYRGNVPLFDFFGASQA